MLKGAVTDTVNHKYQQALEGIMEMPDSGEGDDSAEEDDEGDAGVAALSSESPESKQEKKERRQDMQRAIRRLRKYKPSIKVSDIEPLSVCAIMLAYAVLYRCTESGESLGISSANTRHKYFNT